MKIMKYDNESDLQSIIDEQTALGLHVVAISNVVEGNFIGFDDRDIVPTVTPTPLETQILEGQQTIKDGLADMYIAVASIPGVVI